MKGLASEPTSKALQGGLRKFNNSEGFRFNGRDGVMYCILYIICHILRIILVIMLRICRMVVKRLPHQQRPDFHWLMDKVCCASADLRIHTMRGLAKVPKLLEFH